MTQFNQSFERKEIGPRLYQDLHSIWPLEKNTEVSVECFQIPCDGLANQCPFYLKTKPNLNSCTFVVALLLAWFSSYAGLVTNKWK